MRETGTNSTACVSLVLCLISATLWLRLSFGETPDQEELFANVATIAGDIALVPAIFAVVASRRSTTGLSSLVKVSALVALVCFLWNVGVTALLLIAYCCCPNGLC